MAALVHPQMCYLKNDQATGFTFLDIFLIIIFRNLEFRFTQNFFFQGPIVPCTHAMLAKWIPPSERSRMGAFVYAGTSQFHY